MMDITFGGKTYSMKDTLLVKEHRIVMQTLKTLADFAVTVKDASPEKLAEMTNALNKITVEQWDFTVNIVKRCFALSDEEMDNLHNGELLLLFSEIIQESRQPKKKLEMPSKPESTVAPTQHS